MTANADRPQPDVGVDPSPAAPVGAGHCAGLAQPGWLDAIAALLRRAAIEVMAVYAAPITVRSKADASPVTEADERAEAVIVAGLQALAPAIPVVAEEAVARGAGPDATDCCWLVDPLDGTREFIRRNGEFTLNVGLVVDGAPCLGVLYAPESDRLYAGGPGLGAWRESMRDGRLVREPIATVAPGAGGLRLVTSRSHDDPAATAAWLAGQPVSMRTPLGSSWKFGRLAEGAADAYARPGRTMEWDTAAGHAVLQGAGGDVLGADGRPLRYGKPGWAHDGFVAWGRVPAATG